MMVFVGGTPVGGPVMGWVTDTYGARVGFLSGGLISAAAAISVGLVLARAAGLRPRVDLRRGNGRALVSFVPRNAAPQPPADDADAAGDEAPAADDAGKGRDEDSGRGSGSGTGSGTGGAAPQLSPAV
jgi:hypothetical protein